MRLGKPGVPPELLEHLPQFFDVFHVPIMAYFRNHFKRNATYGIFWLGDIAKGLEIRGAYRRN